MDKGVRVDAFEGACGGEGGVREAEPVAACAAEGVGGEQDDGGADTLATAEEAVAHGLVDLDRLDVLGGEPVVEGLVGALADGLQLGCELRAPGHRCRFRGPGPG